MLTRQADTIRRAREVGHALPDEQRIALGLTLIRMANRPTSFAAVRHAERLIGNHGRQLLAEALRSDEAPYIDMVIEPIHGPVLDHHPGARGSAGDEPRLRVLLRVAWARFWAAEQRLSESFAGDVIAAICFALIVVLFVLGAGVLQ